MSPGRIKVSSVFCVEGYTQQWKVHTLIAVLRETAPDTKLQVWQKKNITGFD